jgi:hypothetical protein
MLSVVKRVEPRDQVEAMLATQMGRVATMTSARELAPTMSAASRVSPRIRRWNIGAAVITFPR